MPCLDSSAGVLTFTPYYHWRWQHAIHHGTSGNLDKRGVGDIWTMTVQEYLESSRWKRFSYRFRAQSLRAVRHRAAVHVPDPAAVRLLHASPRERYSVWWMNLALLSVAVLMSWLFGFWTYLLLQLVAWMVAGASGIWLFYIQHQFEDAYWERDETVGLHRRRAAGQLVLQAAARPAVVLRKHRLPSHPPSEPADSQLQSGAVPPGRADLSAGETHHPVRQLQVPQVPALG